MPSILKKLKIAWDFISFAQLQDRYDVSDDVKSEAGLEWYDHPVVGRYAKTKVGTWWTDIDLKGLGYGTRVVAPGSGPTSDQISRLDALAKKLPTIVAESDLAPIPLDDGWGHRPPSFDIQRAPVRQVKMEADGTFHLLFEVAPRGPFVLVPVFIISPDLALISAEWCV